MVFFFSVRMISKSTSFISLGFSGCFGFFSVVWHCVLFMLLHLEVLGIWFWCSRTKFQFGVCLLFRSWCADGQCLFTGQAERKSHELSLTWKFAQGSNQSSVHATRIVSSVQVCQTHGQDKNYLFLLDVFLVWVKFVCYKKSPCQRLSFSYCPFGLVSFPFYVEFNSLSSCFPTMVSYKTKCKPL